MRVLGRTEALGTGQSWGPCAVAIGIFDGLHLGHQALLDQALHHAKVDGIESIAFSFNPHPAALLAPEKAPKLIEPVSMRIERFADAGMSAALLQPFDRKFADTEAETFVEEALAGKLRAKHVIVGADFCFGRRGRGNVKLLESMGATLGFDVHPVAAVCVDGKRISSTQIRRDIGAGDMPAVQRGLGRPYRVSGAVVRGAGRGAQMGFGTANLMLDAELQHPGGGVYAALAEGDFGELQAVVNVGVTPTFETDGALKVEAHLLDYGGDALYGSLITLRFVKKLRDEMKFANIDELTTQIGEDIKTARVLLRSTD